MADKKPPKFPAIREHFGIFGDHLKLQGIAKFHLSYMSRYINLKVNYQSKHNSVPIYFLFLAIEGKPEICNS